MVTASAQDVHGAWFDQLVPGGLLELPLWLTPSGGEAVVTFRKERDGLRSVAVVEGGFMPLRDGEASPAAPPVPGVSASEMVGGGRLLVTVWGAGVSRLTPRGRRALLAATLGEPRRRPLGVRARRRDLDLFVSLAAPADRLAHRGEGRQSSVGILTGRPPGLAVLGSGATVAAVRAWGGPDAEERLVALVDEWRRAGRPSLDRLVVRARYGARLRAWRTEARPEAYLGFDWGR